MERQNSGSSEQQESAGCVECVGLQFLGTLETCQVSANANMDCYRQGRTSM